MPRLHRYRTTSRLRRFAGASSLFAGLVAWWKLDEASGTRADSTGNHPLAQTGTVGNAAGKVGNAASFTGLANYLARNNTGLGVPSGGSFCYAGWLNVNSVAGTNCVLADFPAAPNSRYTLQQELGVLKFYCSADGTALTNAATGSVITAATWFFFVAQYDAAAGQVGISVNGGAFSTAALAAVLAGGGNVRVGRRTDDGVDYVGLVDELGRWNRLLSAAEIATLYNGGAGRTYPFG